MNGIWTKFTELSQVHMKATQLTKASNEVMVVVNKRGIFVFKDKNADMCPDICVSKPEDLKFIFGDEVIKAIATVTMFV